VDAVDSRVVQTNTVYACSRTQRSDEQLNDWITLIDDGNHFQGQRLGHAEL